MSPSDVPIKRKQKELLAAGIVRDIRFRNDFFADQYLHWLDHRHLSFVVLDSCRCSDGSVILRVVVQYNDADLIDLT